MAPVPLVAGLLGLVSLGLHLTQAEICTSPVCEYDLVIRAARPLAWSNRAQPAEGGYDVVLNGSDLVIGPNPRKPRNDPFLGTVVSPAEVITVDGFERDIITINGVFPGPTLEVMAGAQIVILVTNKLPTEEVTIHWHGLTMRGNTWMDGVPDINQCTITPRRSFTYRLIADPPGTHWYHSHIIRQRVDGLHGLLIVHPHLPVLPEHHLMVGDWSGCDGHTTQINDPSSIDVEDRGTGKGFAAGQDRELVLDGVAHTPLKWYSGLINGRGRYDYNLRFPLATFRVVQGQRYRFRMANVGSDFPLKVSIDGHTLQLVATDGYDVEPMPFTMIIINVGETIDFELLANSTVDRYWLRANTGAARTSDHEVRAVIIYDSLEEGPDPISLPAPCTDIAPCRVYNCPYKFVPSSYNQICVNIDEIRTIGDYNKIAEDFGLADTNVREIFLNLGVQGYGPSINGKRFLNPSGPFFQSDTVVTDCQQVCTDPSEGCFCTHMYELSYGTTIQLIVSSYEAESGTYHHPFHTHGHHFAVVKVGYPTQNETTGRNIAFNPDVTCEGGIGACMSPHWNIKGPPNFNMSSVAIKNTVVVPAWGYIVLRFRADNPGVWLMHCHMSSHQAGGMAIVMLEAPDRLAPPPRGFPQCHNFEMNDDEFAAYRLFAEREENNPSSGYRINASEECPSIPRQGLAVQNSEVNGEGSVGLPEPENAEVDGESEDIEEEPNGMGEEEPEQSGDNEQQIQLSYNALELLKTLLS